jgi:hypothetical protein
MIIAHLFPVRYLFDLRNYGMVLKDRLLLVGMIREICYHIYIYSCVSLEAILSVFFPFHEKNMVYRSATYRCYAPCPGCWFNQIPSTFWHIWGRLAPLSHPPYIWTRRVKSLTRRICQDCYTKPTTWQRRPMLLSIRAAWYEKVITYQLVINYRLSTRILTNQPTVDKTNRLI